MDIDWDVVKLRNEKTRLSGILAQGMKEDDPALDGLKGVISDLEKKVAAKKEA